MVSKDDLQAFIKKTSNMFQNRQKGNKTDKQQKRTDTNASSFLILKINSHYTSVEF